MRDFDPSPSVVRITIIGAGQMGIRHLQAIAKLDRPSIVEVVDPSSTALQQAKNSLQSMSCRGLIQKTIFSSSVTTLTKTSDVAIVSTNAAIRKSVIFELVSHKKVKFLILEKVLFQRAGDYQEVAELLARHGISAFVNCPYRTYSFFQKVKENLKDTILDYKYSGSFIGIGCNSIHHLDLISFLTGEKNIRLNSAQLDAEVITSKRNGFIEFTGTLYGYTNQGSRCTITSYKHEGVPPLLQIISTKAIYLIPLMGSSALVAEAANNWRWKQVPYSMPLQSEWTHRYIQDLLDRKTCDLATYDKSMMLHMEFIRVLLSFLQKQSPDREVSVCPIT